MLFDIVRTVKERRAAGWLRPELLLAAIAAAGLALRLRKAWADIPEIIREATPDDAFYYFQIARNIAGGHNVTFDGETLTNGFHPLWMALLTPIYFFTDDRELAMHVGLTLGALLSVGTILLVYAIVRTLTGNSWAALAGASFYALHPRLVFEAVNGMETSVTALLVASTIWLFVRIAGMKEPPSRSAYLWLGVSAGLMVLARTDTAFILPLLLLYFMARQRGRARWTSTLTIGGAAFLVVAPWALWSLVSFGTVVQVSGVAVAEFERNAFLEANGNSVATQLRQAWDVTNDTLLHQLPHLYFVPRDGPRVAFLFAAAGSIIAMILIPLSPQRRQVTRQLGLLFVPASGVILMLLFHSAIRWHVRPWYFAPVGVLGAVLLGIAIGYVHSVLRGSHIGWTSEGPQRQTVDAAYSAVAFATERWRRPWIVGLYALAALVLVTVYSPRQSEDWGSPLPHRVNMFEAAIWLEENTEREARIGSFNAGIIGYFSDRTVINLDGVVNEDAYRARRDGRMGDYICAEKIDYLADLTLLDDWNSARCRDRPGQSFQMVATVGEPLFYFSGGRVDILQLLPDGAGEASR